MSRRNALEAIIAVAGLLCAGGAASQTASPAADSQQMTRPADVDTWPTIGSTMRMDEHNPALPGQMRQVLMEPGAYTAFARTGSFADGATFGVLFYSVKLDTSHTPPFYHADREVAFAMEVIDRGHPDGRRFYLFANGATRAAPLPAGNACASCHNSRGGFDGTFAQYYPLISRRIAAPAK